MAVLVRTVVAVGAGLVAGLAFSGCGNTESDRASPSLSMSPPKVITTSPPTTGTSTTASASPLRVLGKRFEPAQPDPFGRVCV